MVPSSSIFARLCRLLAVAGSGLVLLVTTGCESGTGSLSPRGPNRPEDPQTVSTFSMAERQIAQAAFQYWNTSVRSDDHTYELDPYDRRISSRFRQQLNANLPVVADPVPATHRIFTFEEMRFPEGDWAYVVYREGNKFHSIEYATVLQRVDRTWEIRDHFLVAAGLIEPVLIDFQWPLYRTRLNKSPGEAE